jgi:Subtilisin-like serine proteases
MEADSTTLKMLSSARGVVRVAEDTLDKPVFDRPWHTRAHHGGHPASGHARPERGRPTLGETIPLIGADKVHALGGTGAHQAVAILDTGIDRTHPFLAGRVVAEACYSNAEGSRGQSLCPNGQASQVGTGAADATTAACRSGGEDLCFHGTHVAGIAAGRKVTGAPADGVAPGADIIAIQVFTRQNSAAVCGGRPPCALSYLSDQLLGLQKVMELSDRYSIAAVNMSLGGAGVKTSPCDSDMRKIAIDALLNRRIATVIAAGNDGATGASVPGCISSAVTVGATDDHDAVADFTNRGQLLDLFAPGVDVTSSVPGGGYYQLSGTSMATPHVTGSFAVLRQARPDATVADILGTLERTGKGVAVPAGAPQPGDSGSLRTRAQVTPRIDLYAAWTALTAPPNKV